MEKAIFEKKIELLSEESDGALKNALTKVALGSADSSVISDLRDVFVSMYASLCRQEGVPSLRSVDEEMALKDRVPDTIANWLTVLSEIFSGTCSVQRVLDPVDTAAILLLKLREWSCLNYEGQFLYGDRLEYEARRRFNQMESEMELLGDKDEILTLVLDGLRGFSSNYVIDKDSLLPGVRTYFLEVLFDYGRGQKSLSIGLNSIAFDQVRLRAVTTEQHILSHLFESLAVLSTVGKETPDNYI